MVELAKSTGHSFCVFSSNRMTDSNDSDLWPVEIYSSGRVFDNSYEKKEMTFDEDFFSITSMLIWKTKSDVLESVLARYIENEILYFDGRK